jgi:hypothetical protein
MQKFIGVEGRARTFNGLIYSIPNPCNLTHFHAFHPFCIPPSISSIGLGKGSGNRRSHNFIFLRTLHGMYLFNLFFRTGWKVQYLFPELASTPPLYLGPYFLTSSSLSGVILFLSQFQPDFFHVCAEGNPEALSSLSWPLLFPSTPFYSR